MNLSYESVLPLRQENGENQYISIDGKTREASSSRELKRDSDKEQRVLADETAKNKESIKEKLWRLERELEKEFKYIDETKDLCSATTAAITETIVTAVEVPE